MYYLLIRLLTALLFTYTYSLTCYMNQTHLFILMVSLAFASSLWAVLLLRLGEPLPVQRYLENLFITHNVESSLNYFGANESDSGYSNKTLESLEKSFYLEGGLTHDVPVRNIHSHNDYWRSRPLLHALSYGVKSVEADVWLFKELGDPIIYVGHALNSLDTHRTLQSLYLNPLVSILKGANPKDGIKSKINDLTKDIDLGNYESEVRDPSGVFSTDSHATLYFLIDFKTDGNELFETIYHSFDELRSLGWLSYYDTTTEKFNWGPITVVGTGNTPLDKVLNQGKIRDIFFDGPLDLLSRDSNQYNLGVSPMVSSSLKKLVNNEYIPISGLTKDQNDRMAKQIEIAHEKGIVTRIWDTPWWPVIREDNIWRQIINAGSDLLNADDLQKAVEFV